MNSSIFISEDSRELNWDSFTDKLEEFLNTLQK